MRAFRIPDRRSFLPDKIFRGSFLDQFQPQREIWVRRPGNHPPVRLAKDGRGALSDLQSSRTQVGAWTSNLLCAGGGGQFAGAGVKIAVQRVLCLDSRLNKSK